MTVERPSLSFCEYKSTHTVHFRHSYVRALFRTRANQSAFTLRQEQAFLCVYFVSSSPVAVLLLFFSITDRSIFYFHVFPLNSMMSLYCKCSKQGCGEGHHDTIRESTGCNQTPNRIISWCPASCR